MPEPIEYGEIVDTLIEKTEAGKVSWTQVYSANAFTCTLDGEFSFRIEKWRDQDDDLMFRLTMTDKENNEIFSVEQVSANILGRKLSELHEIARRIALNVEDKINAVKNILGRI